MDNHERDKLILIIGKLMHCCEVLLEEVNADSYDHLRSLYAEMAHQVHETLGVDHET